MRRHTSTVITDMPATLIEKLFVIIVTMTNSRIVPRNLLGIHSSNADAMLPVVSIEQNPLSPQYRLYPANTKLMKKKIVRLLLGIYSISTNYEGIINRGGGVPLIGDGPLDGCGNAS